MDVSYIKNEQAKCKFGLIGTCWDQGGCVGPSGQRTGPEAVRKAMQKAWGRIQDGKIFDVEAWRLIDVDELLLKDFGDIDDYRVDDWVYSIDRIAEHVCQLEKDGYIPVVIGGDCSIHYPAVKGIHDASNGDIGFVYMDSHFDIWREHPKYGKYSHASPCKNIMDLPRVKGKNTVHFGVRGYGQPFFYEFIKEQGSTPITANEFIRQGVETTGKKIIDVINNGTQKSVLCIDIDVIEGALTPGTAGNEPGGPSSYEFQELVKYIAPHVDAIVLTEVNTNFDVNEITAVQGAKIVNDFIFYKYFSMRGGV